MLSASEAIDITSQRLPRNSPRSRRVGMVSPPEGFSIESIIPEPPSSPVPTTSPPLPVRSPLRPMPRSISDSSTTTGVPVVAPISTRPLRLRKPATPPPPDVDDFASIAEEPLPLAFQIRHQSYLTLLGHHEDIPFEDNEKSKVLQVSSSLSSPISMSMDDGATSSSASSLTQQTPMTKRQYALHELLSSERAYASDLALIREVHIPLALGRSLPLNSISSSPPPPSSRLSSSSQTLSVSSDSSSSSNHGLPMSSEDVRIIFSNIAELAVFSDQFSDALEEALGSTIGGGEGEDHVGALFLGIIPDLEPLYKYYINKHPAALGHLQALPQTPALSAYLAHTQTVASLHSHAWDLSSLLIKPVQRLLKYSLLLAAVIDETPDTHGDKENLKLARLKMEEVAHNVNEGRRRAEVVKEVLTSKKKPVNVGVAASVNLTKMKSLRHGAKPHISPDTNSEALFVEKMHAELKRIDTFAHKLAKDVVDWSKMMSNMVHSLRVWAVGFGKVIGLSPEQGSEAFDAFMVVVEAQLQPLCRRLEVNLNDQMLKEIAHLLITMNQPLKLLASMGEQEPFHHHLLTMNVSAKNRPAPSLLAASTNYLALRGQLAAELPSYLRLLHQGLAISVRRLAQIQAEFWRNVRDQWADLWDMLRVEGEMNAGHEETMAVWLARWGDVDDVMAGLHINQTRKLYQEPPPYRKGPATSWNGMGAVAMGSQELHSYLELGNHVAGTLSSLDPVLAVPVVAPTGVSLPFPITKSPKGRARGSSDASTTTGTKSNASGTPKAHKKKNSGDASEEFVDAVPAMTHPTAPPHTQNPQRRPQTHSGLPRTKSMPLPSERTSSYTSSSSSKTLVDSLGEVSSTRLSQDLQDHEKGRGRSSRRPSLRQKIADSFRPPSKQRSSSSNNFKPTALTIDPSSPPTYMFFDDADAPPIPPTPNQYQPSIDTNRRDSWVNRKGKYVCRVVHPCKPPSAVSYYSFPFFTLTEGSLLEVLQEAGHPSIHPKLPLYVDDGEDCLLLCRDEERNVGWALASFLAPIEGFRAI